MSEISLARFGFNINARINGFDPGGIEAEAGWTSANVQKAWNTIASAMETEVLRRHKIAEPAKPRYGNFLEVARDLSR